MLWEYLLVLGRLLDVDPRPVRVPHLDLMDRMDLPEWRARRAAVLRGLQLLRVLLVPRPPPADANEITIPLRFSEERRPVGVHDERGVVGVLLDEPRADLDHHALRLLLLRLRHEPGVVVDVLGAPAVACFFPELLDIRDVPDHGDPCCLEAAHLLPFVWRPPVAVAFPLSGGGWLLSEDRRDRCRFVRPRREVAVLLLTQLRVAALALGPAAEEHARRVGALCRPERCDEEERSERCAEKHAHGLLYLQLPAKISESGLRLDVSIGTHVPFAPFTSIRRIGWISQSVARVPPSWARGSWAPGRQPLMRTSTFFLNAAFASAGHVGCASRSRGLSSTTIECARPCEFASFLSSTSHIWKSTRVWS